jgi:hypothetical protein
MVYQKKKKSHNQHQSLAFDFDLPAGSRHCSLLPFFDDLGNICLMICEDGVPRSSPVSRPYFSHTLNSSCTWLVLRHLNQLRPMSCRCTR